MRILLAFLAIACASTKPLPPLRATVRRSFLFNGEHVGFSLVTGMPTGPSPTPWTSTIMAAGRIPMR